MVQLQDGPSVGAGDCGCRPNRPAPLVTQRIHLHTIAVSCLMQDLQHCKMLDDFCTAFSSL